MKRNKKIYISGPITGVPGAISAAHFARAEQDLRELGFCNIINPRFMFEGTGLGYNDIMKHCLDLVCSADAVILLPGWKHSRAFVMGGVLFLVTSFSALHRGTTYEWRRI